MFVYDVDAHSVEGGSVFVWGLVRRCLHWCIGNLLDGGCDFLECYMLPLERTVCIKFY